MTETEDEFTTERWACTGLRRAIDGTKQYGFVPVADVETGDGDRKAHYWKMTRDRFVPGGIYNLQVHWGEPDKHGARPVRMRGEPGYTGERITNDTVVAGWEAKDESARRRFRIEAAERKHRRNPRLADAMEPLLQLAAGMTYDERDALATLVHREINRAGEK